MLSQANELGLKFAAMRVGEKYLVELTKQMAGKCPRAAAQPSSKTPAKS